jgi:hypothetical protein
MPPASEQALRAVSSALGLPATSMSTPTPGLVPASGASPSSPVASVNGNVPEAAIGAIFGGMTPGAFGGGSIGAAVAGVEALANPGAPPPPFAAPVNHPSPSFYRGASGVDGGSVA